MASDAGRRRPATMSFNNEDSNFLSHSPVASGFVDKVRLGTFRLFTEILRSDSVSRIKGQTCFIVNFFQLTSLLITPDFFDVDASAHTNALVDTAKLFSFVPLMIQNQSFFSVVYLAVAALPVFFLATCLYVSYKLSQENSEIGLPLNWLRSLCTLWNWLLIIPVTNFLFYTFRCNGDNKMILYESVTCLDDAHVIVISCSLITFLLFCVIAITISLLHRENIPKSDHYLSSTDSYITFNLTTGQILLTIYQAAFSMSTSSYRQIFLILLILLSCSMLRKFFQEIPYYSQSACNIFGSSLILYFWTGIAILANEVINSKNGDILYLIYIGGPFVIKMFVNVIHNYHFRVAFSNLHNLRDDRLILLKLNRIFSWIDSQYTSAEDSLALIGLIQTHVAECVDSTCSCRKRSEIYDAAKERFHSVGSHTTLNQDQVFITQFLKHQYSKALSKFPFSNRLHINFGVFLFHRMSVLHLAYYELSQALQNKPNFVQEFAIYRLQRVIEFSILGEKRGHSSRGIEFENEVDTNIISVLGFQDYIFRLRVLLEENTVRFLDLWKMLSSQRIEVVKLYSLLDNIDERNTQIRRLWIRIQKINPNYQRILSIYGSYLLNVANSETESEEIREKAKALKTRRIDNEMGEEVLEYDEGSVIVTIEAERRDLGKIVKVNDTIERIYGYSKSEIIGNNVKLFLPGIMAQYHDNFILNYIEHGEERVMNKIREVYSCDHNGYLLPTHILVKAVPSIHHGMRYVGFLRRISSKCENILTDESGNIDSFSSRFGKYLSLPPNFIKNQKVNIKCLVKELFDEMVTKKENLDTKLNIKCNHYHDFTFHNLRDLTARIKRFNEESAKRNFEIDELYERIWENFLNVDSMCKVQFRVTVTKLVTSQTTVLIFSFTNRDEDEDETSSSTGSTPAGEHTMNDESTEIDKIKVKSYVRQGEVVQVPSTIHSPKRRRTLDKKATPTHQLQQPPTVHGGPRRSSRKKLSALFFPGEKNGPAGRGFREVGVDAKTLKSPMQTMLEKSPRKMSRQKSNSPDAGNIKRKSLARKTGPIYPSFTMSTSSDEVTPATSKNKGFERKNSGVRTPTGWRRNSVAHIEDFDFQRLKEVATTSKSGTEGQNVIVNYSLNKDQKKTNLGLSKNTAHIKDLLVPTPGHPHRSRSKKSKKRRSDRDDNRSSESGRSVRSMKLAAGLEKKTRSIRLIIFGSYLLYLILAAIGATILIFQLTLFVRVESTIDLIHEASDREFESLAIGFKSRQLNFINRGLYTKGPEGEPIDEYETELKKEMGEALVNLRKVQHSLSRSDHPFQSASEEISPDNIELTFVREDGIPAVYKFDMLDAVMEVVSMGFKVNNYPIELITTDSAEVQFLTFNTLNEFYEALHTSREGYVNEADLTNEQNEDFMQIFIILALAVMIVAPIFLVPLIGKVYDQRNFVLQLMIKISSNDLKEIIHRCDTFLSEIGGDMALNRAISAEDDGNLKGKKKSQRRRKHNKKLIKPRRVYLPMLLQLLGFIVVICLYFSALYVVSESFLDLSNLFVGEVSELSDKTPDHFFLVYALAEIIFLKFDHRLTDAKLLGEPFEEKFARVTVELFNKEEKFLLLMIEDNMFLSDDSRDSINEVMFGNLCEVLELTSEIRTICKTTSDDVLTHGLHPGIMMYWEHLNQVYSDYQSTSVDEDIAALLQNHELLRAEKMRDYFFHKAYSKLYDILLEDLKRNLNQIGLIYISLFVVYIFCIGVYNAMIWSKNISKLVDELRKAHSLISYLPTDTIRRNQGIKKYLIRNSDLGGYSFQTRVFPVARDLVSVLMYKPLIS